MKQRLYSLNLDDRGFTLIEVVAVVALSMIVVVMVSGAIISHKTLYKREVIRTQMNQELRGLFDIIASEIRLVGENFPSTYPAVVLEDGTSGAPDTLILRRNLLDVVLKVCTVLTKNSSDPDVFFSLGKNKANPKPSTCIYANNTSNYEKWSEYFSENNNSGTLTAYILNQKNDKGEYFEFDEVEDTGTKYKLNAVNHTWENTYNKNTGWIYLIEEWELTLTGDTLQLIEGSAEENPLNLASNIKDFQVSINMQDGSVLTEFDESNDWTQVQNIEMTITSERQVVNDVVEAVWTTKLFPRNIISTY